MENKNIICVSVSDWLKPWGSKQHLMVKLAQRNRVLYVEYQGSFLDIVKYPGYFLTRFCRINKVRKINANIYLYTPVPGFPFGNYSIFINKVNQAILSFALRRIIKKLEFNEPVLWVYSPSSVELAGRLNERTIVYHCAADFTNEKKNHLRQRAIDRLQTRLVKEAKIVLTLTRGLHARFIKLNSNTFYFPSAVNIEYFNVIREGNSEEPADLAILPKPRLGVVGYLDGNILDISLLDYIAKADSGLSIVMIGPLFRNRSALIRLRQNKNVHFLGEKQPSMIPLYLKYLDICLIPYVRNEFTKNVSPIKLYEYLAMGKAVVSTSFSDELSACSRIIGIADCKEEFLRLIKSFLKHKDEEKSFMERIEFASSNSWQNRVEFLGGLI